MKEEMQLVQEMEDAEDRDSEAYVDKLEQILGLKLDTISSLRDELRGFQSHRQAAKDREAKLMSDLSDGMHGQVQISAKVKSLRRQSSGSGLLAAPRIKR